MNTTGNIYDILRSATFVSSARSRTFKRGHSKGRSTHATHFEQEGKPLCGARRGAWQADFAGPCNCIRCLHKIGL